MMTFSDLLIFKLSHFFFVCFGLGDWTQSLRIASKYTITSHIPTPILKQFY